MTKNIYSPKELQELQASRPDLRGTFYRVPLYPEELKGDESAAVAIGELQIGENAADTLKRVISLGKKLSEGTDNGKHFFRAG